MSILVAVSGIFKLSGIPLKEQHPKVLKCPAKNEIFPGEILIIVVKPVVGKGLKFERQEYHLSKGIISVFGSSAIARKNKKWKNICQLVFFKKNIFDWHFDNLFSNMNTVVLDKS